MHDFEIMDTLPGTQPSDTSEGARAPTIMRQPLRVMVNDPITLLPTLFARSTAPVAVVLDADEKPLGTIRPASLLRCVDQHGRASLAGMSVRTLTEPAVALPESSSLLDLLHAFSARSHEQLLVADANGRLAGMVTAADLLYVASGLLSLSIGGLMRQNHA